MLNFCTRLLREDTTHRVAVGVKSQAGGAVQLTFAVAAFAPLGEYIAVGVKGGNLVFPFVRGIHIAVGVGGYAGEPGKEAAGAGLVGDAFAAEFADIFLVNGEFGDAGAGVLFAGAVSDIQHAVRARRHAYRLAEAHAHLRVAADVVAVQPRPPAGYGVKRHGFVLRVESWIVGVGASAAQNRNSAPPSGRRAPGLTSG